MVYNNDNISINNASSFSGEYFNASFNNKWSFTAKKNCRISYVSTQRNSTTNRIVEYQDVAIGDIINQPLDGVFLMNVIDVY